MNKDGLNLDAGLHWRCKAGGTIFYLNDGNLFSYQIKVRER